MLKRASSLLLGAGNSFERKAYARETRWSVTTNLSLYHHLSQLIPTLLASSKDWVRALIAWSFEIYFLLHAYVNKRNKRTSIASDLSYSKENLRALFLAVLAHDLVTPLLSFTFTNALGTPYFIAFSPSSTELFPFGSCFHPLTLKTLMSSLLCLKFPFLASYVDGIAFQLTRRYSVIS